MKILYFILMIGFVFDLQGCQKHTSPETDILFYTCSMHRFIKENKPGRCPICGMDLTPVYKGQKDLEGVQLSPEQEKNLGLKTEAAKVRPLLRRIEAMGRVAYDPELYVAQNDYLIARRSGGGALAGLQGQLVKAARSRLELLGMNDVQIRELEKRGRAQGSLLVPRKGEEVLLYGAVFESDLPLLKIGDAVEVRIPGVDKAFTSWIVSIDPTLDAQTRTAQIRVPLKNTDGELRPSLFVKMAIQAQLGNALSVPVDAVLETGERALIYVVKQDNTYQARQVTLGKRGEGYVEILSGLSEGEEVVIRGAFLLDSEASLRGIGVEPSAEGGHQH